MVGFNSPISVELQIGLNFNEYNTYHDVIGDGAEYYYWWNRLSETQEVPRYAILSAPLFSMETGVVATILGATAIKIPTERFVAILCMVLNSFAYYRRYFFVLLNSWG